MHLGQVMCHEVDSMSEVNRRSFATGQMSAALLKALYRTLASEKSAVGRGRRGCAASAW